MKIDIVFPLLEKIRKFKPENLNQPCKVKLYSLIKRYLKNEMALEYIGCLDIVPEEAYPGMRLGKQIEITGSTVKADFDKFGRKFVIQYHGTSCYLLKDNSRNIIEMSNGGTRAQTELLQKNGFEAMKVSYIEIERDKAYNIIESIDSFGGKAPMAIDAENFLIKEAPIEEDADEILIEERRVDETNEVAVETLRTYYELMEFDQERGGAIKRKQTGELEPPTAKRARNN